MTAPALPSIVAWLLSVLPEEWRESIAGDLVEERERRRIAGRSHGAVWTTTAALQVAWQLGWERFGARASRRHELRRSAIMQGFISDLRQSGRRLLGQKGFTVVAVLTLALGIGANTAVFNLANWLLLRPVPGIHDLDSLVSIGFGTETGARGPIAYPDFVAIANGTPAFADLAGYQTFDLHVAPAGGEARRAQVDVVTPRYFEMLGAPVRQGRAFTEEESTSAAAAPVAVISDRMARRDFAATGAIGRSIALNGHPFTVIGVAVAGFHGPTRTGATDVWVPLAQHQLALPMYRTRLLQDRQSRVLFGLIGRLGPGMSIDAAASQIDAVRASLAASYPNDRRMQNWRFVLQPGIEARPWVRDRLGRSMTLLLGSVGLLLMLTCANVANLMLARATSLRGEVATRRALGATRWRVTRLLLTESLVLSIAAGLASLALSWLVSRLLQGTAILQGLPPLERAQADGALFAFAVGVSAIVAIGAGLLPAIAGGRVALTDALRDTARSQTASRRRIRRALTVAQVAVSLTLLIGAGLLARS
ncbi:MAG TPA: ABC transporter permease, partial [Vicinamibacterales bacterium]|nr:ABC transporter permease [Vicinamibacterales bacterium]